MVFKVGDRVAAYDHNDIRVGKGVIVMTQALRGDYCKVKLDRDEKSKMPGGVVMAFRQDKLKRLVPKEGAVKIANPFVVRLTVHMNTGAQYTLANTPEEIAIFASACLGYEAPLSLNPTQRNIWVAAAGRWGAFLRTHNNE